MPIQNFKKCKYYRGESMECMDGENTYHGSCPEEFEYRCAFIVKSLDIVKGNKNELD